MNLPNLIIAGVSKAGTTSLFAYLEQHPQICPSRVKETRYFTPLRDGAEPRPIHEYSDYFSHCEGSPVRMEATPNYFYGGPQLIERIVGTLPDVRVIVSLRNPVDRLWSSYIMKVRKGRSDTANFDDFVERCLAADRGSIGDPTRRYRSLATGRYAEYLPEWAGALGPRLKVVFLEQWTKDPAGEVARICDWMGLDADAGRIDFRVRNPATLHRNRRLWKLARAINRRLHLVLLPRPELKRRLTGLYRLLNATHVNQQMSPATRARLEEIYSLPNARLRRQLDDMGYSNLPSWLEESAPRDGDDHSESKDFPSNA